jgi:cytochrome c6
VLLNSAEQFTRSCAGCHTGGGNVVEGTQTLKLDALERNGLTSEDALYQIIYSGKRKMPGYGEGCAPKGACTFGPRLSDDVIRGLAQYVSEQAKAGWPQ